MAGASITPLTYCGSTLEPMKPGQVEQLADITSAVNILGREVQSELNGTHRCYYWYFQDQSQGVSLFVDKRN